MYQKVRKIAITCVFGYYWNK